MFEFTGEPDPEDPDEIARALLSGTYRQQAPPPMPDEFLARLQADDADGGEPPGDNGGRGGFEGEDVGGGDWQARPPTDSHVSAARESVTLPISVRIMYDWARANGWHQGDDSLSAFVTDILLDHWRNCWGKMIGVLDRAEVDVA